MRVMFTSLPATGHFNSTLPLALGVQAAGHDVAYCCAPAFRDDTIGLGFEHRPGGAATFAELFEGGPPIGPARAQWAQAVAFATRGAGRMLPDLLEHVRDWQPDVLVRESAEYGALLAAEQLDLPHASIATGAWAARDDRREVVADALTDWRVRLGLPPDPDATAIFRYLSYSFMPPSWDGADPGTYPATAQFIRYVNPQRAGVARPEWLDMPRRDPLVLASLGTVMHAESGLLEAIIAALADEPVQVVAAIGRDQDTDRFGTPPANVHLERYVPQIPVLEACSLFVTHGGFNSTKEALSLGVPLVVIPIAGDQPYSAARVEALGLGRAVQPHERTADVIRTRVREVMGDARFLRNARAFADEMRALPPVTHAVRLLERLAASRKPVLRA